MRIDFGFILCSLCLCLLGVKRLSVKANIKQTKTVGIIELGKKVKQKKWKNVKLIVN